MDDIDPGGMTERTINADLYGQENSTKEIGIKVFYQVPGSNATFEKDKTYDVLVSSSPLTISVSSFNQVTAGQKFDMTVTLTSNSQSTIKNLLLNAVYPFGYSFITSDQTPLADKATWNVGRHRTRPIKNHHLERHPAGQRSRQPSFSFFGRSGGRRQSICHRHRIYRHF